MTTDLQTLWRELQAANQVPATLDEPADDARMQRIFDAEDAIVQARPRELGGLAVQLRFFQQVLDGSDPSEAHEAMLTHVADQLEVLAGRAAA